MVRLAVQLGALGTVELVAAQFDTVASAAGQCHGPVATGVMPTGGWR